MSNALIRPRHAVSATAILATLASAGAIAASPATAASAPVGGGQVLYTLNGNLWQINADGTGKKQLTSGGGIGDATYSPNGQKIAYQRKGAGGLSDIFVMNANGTGKVNLTNTPTVVERYPSFSPDGTKIALERSGSSPNPGVAIMNAVPGAPQKTIKKNDSAFLTYGRPDWSPKGNRIAIEFIDRTGDHGYTAVELITPTGTDGGWSMSDAYQPEFDPTGTRIAATYWDYLSGSWIQWKSLTGTGTTDIYEGQSDSVWSPDGKRLAMLSFDYDNGIHQLVLTTLTGTVTKKLVVGTSSAVPTPRAWRAG